MPRHSPFRIQLTREERRELEARARRYTSPYRDVIRAKLARVGEPDFGSLRARLEWTRVGAPRLRHFGG